MICINKRLIGTDRHLLYDGDVFSWARVIPEESWLCGFSQDHARSVDTIAALSGKEIDIYPGTSYIEMWDKLRPTGIDGVPISKSLPKREFNSYLNRLVDQSWNLVKDCQGKYHANEFMTIRQFLLGLGRCKVDVKRLRDILDKNQAQKSSVESFRPEVDGLLRKIRYSQTSSCSGRLTVKEGPSILTLRKDLRSLLMSTRTSGNIVQIDFVSLEPRVALSVAGLSPTGDIYENIIHDVLGGDVNRDAAKIATIGSLYGMSAKRMSDVIQSKSMAECRSILRRIRDYFKIPQLDRSLKRDLSSTGRILSHYGKEMKPDTDSGHVLVNRFIQSTASDAAILGFSLLTDTLRNSDIDFDPIFVIHDALIIDVSSKSLKSLKRIVEEFSSPPGLQGSFPLSFEIIS
jgi:hypothetical protein